MLLYYIEALRRGRGGLKLSIIVRDVIYEQPLRDQLTVEGFVLSMFLLRFNDVKNGCPDKQVGKGGNNKA